MKKTELRKALRAAQRHQIDNLDRTISIENTSYADEEGTVHQQLLVWVLIDAQQCKSRTLNTERFDTAVEFDNAIKDALRIL